MVKIIAKTEPEQTLLEHTAAVLRACEVLKSQFEIDPNIYTRAQLACALHDVGKATISFQEYMAGKRGRAYPHALASLPFVMIVEAELIRQKRFTMPFIASLSVLSHHTAFTASSFDSYIGGHFPEYHKNEIYEFLDKMSAMLDFGIDFANLLKKYEKEWYNRDISSFVKILKDSLLKTGNSGIKQYYSVKALLNASDWSASSENNITSTLTVPTSNFVKRYALKNDFSLRAFQVRSAEEHGNIFLQAPTGTGKTESLLLWSKNRRLIYLLPTQSTVNAMWLRLRRIFSPEKVGLLHGMSQIIMHKSEYAQEEYNNSSLNFEHVQSSVFMKPVMVSTLDQYLLISLHGKHWENKAFFTAHSDMILDEIHAYSPYTLGLLIGTLLKYHPRRVAISSATFPTALKKLIKAEIGEFTEISAEDKLWDRKRIRMKLHDCELFSAVNDVVLEAEAGKNVLVVLNTVADAQEFFRRINYPHKMLLHSRFVYRDRAEKEKILSEFGYGENGAGFILVATQVVEVSLDISFDVMYTVIAPIDALVQRFGRVNRQGEKGICKVNVFLRYTEQDEKVYGSELLELSSDLLKKIPDMPKESDFLRVNDVLYEDIMSSEEFVNDYKLGKNKPKEFEKILRFQTIDFHNNESVLAEFFTRKLTYLTESVIPSSLAGAYEDMVENGERWRVKELMVPVPLWWLKKFGYVTRAPGITIAYIKYDSVYGAMVPDYDDIILG